MSNKRKCSLLLVVPIVLASCAGGEDLYRANEEGMDNPRLARLAETDWSQAETLEVSLTEFAYDPAVLTFKVGSPYRLRLSNLGEVTHYFVSEAFFEAIDVWKLEKPDGAVERPRLQSVALEPGSEKEIWFVASLPGDYEFYCTAPLHSLLGMEGQIRIVPEGQAGG